MNSPRLYCQLTVAWNPPPSCLPPLSRTMHNVESPRKHRCSCPWIKGNSDISPWPTSLYLDRSTVSEGQIFCCRNHPLYYHS